MANVIVTGGTGFIGSALAHRLAREGHQVLLTGYHQSPRRPLAGPVVARDFNAIVWTDLPEIDAVFHQAAIASTLDLDRARMFDVNVTRAIQLMHTAALNGVPRFVYASSASVYGEYETPQKAAESWSPRPLNPYAASKAELDRSVCDYYHWHLGDMQITSLRYSNVYGPGEEHKGPMRSVVLQCWERMSEGKPPLLFDGRYQRDFVHVDDVVQANLQACGGPAGCYNIGSGVACDYEAIPSIIGQMMGRSDVEVQRIPNGLLGRYQPYTCLDITRARELLGWQPAFKLGSGIRAYLQPEWDRIQGERRDGR